MIWNGVSIARLDKIRWGAKVQLVMATGAYVQTSSPLVGEWAGRGLDNRSLATISFRPEGWSGQLLTLHLNDVREVIVIETIPNN